MKPSVVSGYRDSYLIHGAYWHLLWVSRFEDYPQSPVVALEDIFVVETQHKRAVLLHVGKHNCAPICFEPFESAFNLLNLTCCASIISHFIYFYLSVVYVSYCVYIIST